MTLIAKTTHTWDVEDDDGPLVHIEATKDVATVSLPRGKVYLSNAELRELARAANAAARV